MKKSLKDCPSPLLRKIIATPLIGAGCLVLGTAMFIGLGDRTLLLLSGVLFIACAIRGFLYYRIAVSGRYEAVSGTCIRLSPQLVGKLRKVHIMDDKGVESVLRLPKQHGFKIGERYRFYFQQRPGFSTGGEYLDAMLSAGAFLGYEPEDSLEKEKAGNASSS